MTKPAVYYWPPISFEGIALLSNNLDIPVGGRVTLKSNNIDGSFSYSNILNKLTSSNDITCDIIRNISITSDTDNSGTDFLIQGVGPSVFIESKNTDSNGNPLGILGNFFEYLSGPTTLEEPSMSVNIYSSILDISIPPFKRDGETPNNPATNISVGYGDFGVTNYYMLDCNRVSIQGYGSTYTRHFVPSPSSGLHASVYTSLNKPQSPTISGGLRPFGIINDTNVTFIPAFNYGGSINQNENDIIDRGFQVIWANITGSNGTDSFFFTVMQQGI